EARAAGSPPALAEASLRLGINQIGIDLGATVSEDALREAIRAAAQARDARTEAIAWAQLIRVIADNGRAPQALALRVAAEAAAERAGAGDDVRALVSYTVGGALRSAGKLDEARRAYEAAMALDERAFGADSDHVAGDASALGQTLKDVGKLDEAAAMLE